MDTKQQILEKSEDMFMRYGIKSITMDDIARELGMSKKTLYQYVDNKADLINKVIKNFVEEETKIVEDIGNMAKNAIDEMVYIAEHVLRILRTLRPTMMYDLKKYYRKSWDLMESLNHQHIYLVIKKNLERGIEQNLYRPELNADIVARLYMAKTSLIVDEDLFPSKKYKREELYVEFITLHMRGIASPKGLEILEQQHFGAK